MSFGQDAYCITTGSFEFCKGDDLQDSIYDGHTYGKYGFVGCCERSICLPDDCYDASSGLRPASFDPSAYTSDQLYDCESGDFYNCYDLHSSIPFVGCCSMDPCGDSVTPQPENGCPDENLGRAIYVSPLTHSAETSLQSTIATLSAANESRAFTVTQLVSALTSVSSPSPTAAAQASSPKLHPGVAAGIAVGGSAVLALVALLAFLAFRKGHGTSKRDKTPKLSLPSATNQVWQVGPQGAQKLNVAAPSGRLAVPTSSYHHSAASSTTEGVGQAPLFKNAPSSIYISPSAQSEAPELVVPGPPAYAQPPSGPPSMSTTPHMSAFLDLRDDPAPRNSFQQYVFRPLSAIGAKSKRLIGWKGAAAEGE